MAQGGAQLTAKPSKRPWEMTAIVSGFPSKSAALQFEWAWQNPHKTRHIPEEEYITPKRYGKTRKGVTKVLKGRETIKHKVQNLHLLLRGSLFRRWPLELRFFSQDTFGLWQESRNEATVDISPRIAVHLDESVGMDVTEGPPTAAASPVSLAGVAALDVTYAPFKPHLTKSVGLLNGDKPLHCSGCHETMNKENDLILVCPAEGCDMASHLLCLSRQFIASQDDQDALIPIEGACPGCHAKLRWSDLMRDLTLRTRAESAVKLLMKEPRRKKATKSELTADQAMGAGSAATVLSTVNADRRREASGEQQVEVLDEDDSDLDDPLDGAPEDEDNLPEIWHDIDSILGLELEREDEGSLPTAQHQRDVEERRSTAQNTSLPKIIPDSEFEDIDDILD